MSDCIELSTRAVKELRGLQKKDRERIESALRKLEEDPLPPNLDVRPLLGAKPWWRLRVGNFRVVYRALGEASDPETGSELPDDCTRGYLVDCIIDRQYLEKVVARYRNS